MTATATPAARPSSVVRSFKPKDAFGQPRFFLKNAESDDKTGIPHDGQRFQMGVFYGTVEKADTKLQNQNDGTVKEWPVLKGKFEAIPARDELAVQRMSDAFIPEHLYNDIKATLDAGAVSVDVAFKVFIETKASSSAGFVWVWDQMVETRAADPLAHLRAAALGLPAPAQATIAAPATDEPATDGDAPKGKGKGK